MRKGFLAGLVVASLIGAMAWAQGDRGGRPAASAPATIDSPTEIKARTDWLADMDREFPRQMTQDDTRDLMRIQNRMALVQGRESKKIGAVDAAGEWAAIAGGFLGYLPGWDCYLALRWNGSQASELVPPSGETFLAGLEDQPFLFHWIVEGDTALPVFRTAHVNLRAGEARIAVEPGRSTLAKVFITGIEPGAHTYPLLVESPEGKELARAELPLKGVVPAKVRIRILDEKEGKPTEVFAGLFPSNGRDLPTETTPFVLMDSKGITREVRCPGSPAGDIRVFITKGTMEATVYPGPCHVVATKGPEYLSLDETFDAPSGGVVEKDFTLRRFVDMRERGWISGDDHCHVARNPIWDDDIQDALSAADIGMANIVQMGDEDRLYFLQSTWGEPSQRWRDGRAMASGQEDPRTMWRGHALMFNLQGAVHDRNTYFLYEDAFKEARRQGGLTGYAHSARTFGAEFSSGMTAALGLMDFVELESGSAYDRDVLYHLWNLGFRLTATGGSDYPYGPVPGGRRFFTRLEGEFTVGNYLHALKAGRTFTSTGGAFIDMKVNGQLPGSRVPIRAGDSMRVEGTAWMNPDYDKIRRVEIVVDGEVATTIQPKAGDEEHELRFACEVPATQNGWIAGRVLGDKSNTDAKGERFSSSAHTTPWWIEVEGKSWRDRRGLPAEVARANKNLDRMTELAQQKSPLMDAQRERLLKYVEDARGIINAEGGRGKHTEAAARTQNAE